MSLLGDMAIGGLILLAAISILAALGLALGKWVPYAPNDG